MPAKFDFHVHTMYSDGEGKAAAIVEAAEARGLEAVALTDHGPEHGIGTPRGKLLQMLQDIQLARTDASIRVLAGIEANIIEANGSIDIDDEFIRKLDVVVVGIHSLRGVAKNPLSLARSYLEAATNAIKRQRMDIFAHPFYFYGYLVHNLSPEDVEMFVKLAAERGVAMEVNSKYRVPDEYFLRLCMRQGVRLSIGTDAHTPVEVGRIDWVLAMLRRSGAKREDLILDRFLR